jgi:hypothetical protein
MTPVGVWKDSCFYFFRISMSGTPANNRRTSSHNNHKYLTQILASTVLSSFSMLIHSLLSSKDFSNF